MSELNMKEEMVKQLELRLEEFRRDPGQESSRRLTDAFVNCLVHDGAWLVPVRMAEGEPGEEERTELLAFQRMVLDLNGREMVFTAFTTADRNVPDGLVDADTTVAMSCRGILRDLLQSDVADQLLLNPGTDDIFITKQQAEVLLAEAERQNPPRVRTSFRRKRGTSYRMITCRPMTEQSFAVTALILRSLKDLWMEYLVCSVEPGCPDADADREEVLFIQAISASAEGMLRVEICLEPEHDGERYRALLYDEMPAEEAVEYFRGVLVENGVPERTRRFHVLKYDELREDGKKEETAEEEEK